MPPKIVVDDDALALGSGTDDAHPAVFEFVQRRNMFLSGVIQERVNLIKFHIASAAIAWCIGCMEASIHVTTSRR